MSIKKGNYLIPDWSCGATTTTWRALLLIHVCRWWDVHHHIRSSKSSRCCMCHKPCIDNIPCCFSYKIFLRKFLMLIKPWFHPCKFHIVMIVLVMITIIIVWMCRTQPTVIVWNVTYVVYIVFEPQIYVPSVNCGGHSALGLLYTPQMQTWKKWH